MSQLVAIARRSERDRSSGRSWTSGGAEDDKEERTSDGNRVRLIRYSAVAGAFYRHPDTEVRLEQERHDGFQQIQHTDGSDTGQNRDAGFERLRPSQGRSSPATPHGSSALLVDDTANSTAVMTVFPSARRSAVVDRRGNSQLSPMTAGAMSEREVGHNRDGRCEERRRVPLAAGHPPSRRGTP
ncbi:hypothetical protein C9J85_11555 [Haloferax sp. wsp5]|nr:hypothetical protein C9J85_11555 [Haloferax sp. wsp5]